MGRGTDKVNSIRCTGWARSPYAITIRPWYILNMVLAVVVVNFVVVVVDIVFVVVVVANVAVVQS